MPDHHDPRFKAQKIYFVAVFRVNNDYIRIQGHNGFNIDIQETANRLYALGGSRVVAKFRDPHQGIPPVQGENDLGNARSQGNHPLRENGGSRQKEE